MLSIAESDKDTIIATLEAELKAAKATIERINEELIETKKDLQIITVWFIENDYVTNADLEEARARRAADNVVEQH